MTQALVTSRCSSISFGNFQEFKFLGKAVRKIMLANCTQRKMYEGANAGIDVWARNSIGLRPLYGAPLMFMRLYRSKFGRELTHPNNLCTERTHPNNRDETFPRFSLALPSGLLPFEHKTFHSRSSNMKTRAQGIEDSPLRQPAATPKTERFIRGRHPNTLLSRPTPRCSRPRNCSLQPSRERSMPIAVSRGAKCI